jgi:hypothetical protein
LVACVIKPLQHGRAGMCRQRLHDAGARQARTVGRAN